MSISGEKYKNIKRMGVTTIILHKGKVLLAKRVNLPFIFYPGVWYFISGGRKDGDTCIETAYREIKEETGLDATQLKLLYQKGPIFIVDRKKGIKWANQLFIFCSKSSRIHLNIEHSTYKWVDYEELTRHEQTLDAIYEKEELLAVIKSQLNKC